MKVTGTKNDSLNIRRLQRVTAKDSHRLALNGIYVSPHGDTWATNGFIAMAIPTPDGLDNAEGSIIDLDISAGEFEADAEPIDATYPDIGVCRPTNEPAAEIVVNAKFLKEIGTLAGDQPVRIKIYEPTQPFEIASADMDSGNTSVYALVMPMHSKNDSMYSPAA